MGFLRLYKLEASSHTLAKCLVIGWKFVLLLPKDISLKNVQNRSLKKFLTSKSENSFVSQFPVKFHSLPYSRPNGFWHKSQILMDCLEDESSKGISSSSFFQPQMFYLLYLEWYKQLSKFKPIFLFPAFHVDFSKVNCILSYGYSRYIYQESQNEIHLFPGCCKIKHLTLRSLWSPFADPIFWNKSSSNINQSH